MNPNNIKNSFYEKTVKLANDIFDDPALKSNPAMVSALAELLKALY